MVGNSESLPATRASRRHNATKINRPSNYTGKYTWVSKDASNLSTITKEELHHVHSHIQARFVPWARKQKDKKVQSDIQRRKNTTTQLIPSHKNIASLPTPSAASSEADCTPESTETTENCDTTSSDRDPPAQPRRVNSCSTASGSSLADSNTPWSTPECVSDTSHQYPTPFSLVGTGNGDPFDASTIYIDASRHELLLLWGERVMNGIWPSLRTLEAKLAANKAWAEDCRDGVWDEGYLHGLLASALVVKARLLQAADASTATRLRIQSHVHQASCLKWIRDELSRNSAGLRQILVIWAVASIYLLDADVSTCRIHLTSLKRMTDDMGGMKKLPALVQNKILLWDLATSGFLLQKPVFPVSDWGSRSLDELFASLVLEPEVIGQLKFSISMQNCLPFHPILTRRLQTRFTEHREATAVKTLADRFSTDSETANTLDCWLYPRQRFLEASNLFLFHDIIDSHPIQESKASSDHDTGKSLESCLCLAVSFLHRFIARHTLESAGCTPFYHLQACLLSFIQASSKEVLSSAAAALLWMYFVGACAEESISRNAPSTQGSDWFTKNVLYQARELGLLSFSSLRETFRLFLYDADTLDDFLLCILCKQELEELVSNEEHANKSRSVIARH